MNPSVNLIRRATRLGVAAVAMILCSGASAEDGPRTSFGNAAIGIHWQADGHLDAMRIVDHVNNRTIAVKAAFILHLADGTKLTAADFDQQGAAAISMLPGDPKASRLSERGPRRQLQTTFVDEAGRFRVVWTLIQSPDASYFRALVTVSALLQDEKISRIDLLNAEAPDADADVVGRVDGSPVVAGPNWLQFENPLAKSATGLIDPSIELWINRALPLQKGKSVTYSVAVGATRPGQLRRDFQAYIENERAHPYRQNLHYNSWYDIGYMTAYTAPQAVERINAFCDELSRKRGVKIDSFLFDDGWDDRGGDWNFSKDFPDGFVPLKSAAAKCDASLGVWLSPWGGYDKPKIERLKNANGKYETIDGGFALSGPQYYQRFHDVLVDFVSNQGVNHFKLDGTGNANQVVAGSKFDSDFDAAITLVDDMRAIKPDLFVNLTTGTYPSPAWLRYVDTIWRGGHDHDYAGVGSPRERWITYRDQQVYENIVVAGPLFPINSLMVHGVIYAQHLEKLNTDPGDDFGNEVNSFFASGTALQELYITPSLLTQKNWDTLAHAARWARENQDILRDTHWLGGRPKHLDVYGWAAWSKSKSIITLRNPDNKPQSFLLDLTRALELPPGSPKRYSVKAVWGNAAKAPATLTTQKSTIIALAPFDVVTLELTPRR